MPPSNYGPEWIFLYIGCMKHLIACFCLLICFACYSQSKGDSKIVVQVADTSGLFNKVALYFYENGYTIASKDPALGFLATDEKSLGSRSIKVNALVKDSAIVFTSQWANNVTLDFGGVKTERIFYPVKFVGMKGSDIRIAWEEMSKVAKSFGEVSYLK